MPSPLGHALGGLLVGLAMVPARAGPRVHDLAICAAAASLPDIDFLWGRHAMETHSMGAALLAGSIVFIATRRRLALACALAWLSHVVFDWLGSDDYPPLGVMALWPLTDDFYFAHAYVFEAISRQYHAANFWSQNLWAVTKEILLLLPPVGLLAWWRRRESRIL